MATAIEGKVGVRAGIHSRRLRPPRIAQALLVVSVGLHFWLRDSVEWHFGSWPGGIALFAGGFALMMWAWWLFRKRETAICPTDAASVLVASGPFRWTRNPMYLGMTTILAGCAWALGTIPAFVAPVGFFLVMNTVFVPFEERRLTELFGSSYTEYCRSVRRWI